jgi:uncharacterized protein (DUF488 family)
MPIASDRYTHDLGAEVYTLGFSNRTWEKTLEILASFAIERLIDVRTLPGSRHTPQFNQDQLESALPRAGVEYFHMRSLGGLRKAGRGAAAATAGWRNAGFRGYAEYMQTPAFEAALDELVRLFSEQRSVYCCTEAVFWRCHRALLSDALAARGFSVGHIFDARKVEPHRITSFARINGSRVTYPIPDDEPGQKTLWDQSVDDAQKF